MGCALMVAVLSGCDEASSDGRVEPIEEDSAGIAIVRSPDPAEEPVEEWRVEPGPYLSIGSMEGEDAYLFTDVTDAGRVPGGRVFVTGYHAWAVRLFDQDGHFIEAWGRSGRGPGEFGLPVADVYPYRGDSVAVAEMAGRQISIFDHEGRFGRRVAPRYGFQPTSGHIPAESCCILVGALPDGSWLAEYPEEVSPEGPARRRGRVRVVRLSPEGDVTGEFGVFDGGLWRETPDMPSPVLPTPLNPGLSLALAGDRVLVGHGLEYRVDEFDRRGRLPRSFRIDRARRPLGDSAAAAYEQATRRAYAEAGVGEARIEELLRFELANLPDRFPAYRDLLTDPNGHVWLIPFHAPHAAPGEEKAFVLDSSGVLVATANLPSHIRIFESTQRRSLESKWTRWGSRGSCCIGSCGNSNERFGADTFQIVTAVMRIMRHRKRNRTGEYS